MLGCIRYTRAVARVTVVRQLVPPTPRLRRPKPTRMRLKPDIIPYLLGEKFSNGLMVEFDFEAEDSCVRSRIDWLELLCFFVRTTYTDIYTFLHYGDSKR